MSRVAALKWARLLLLPASAALLGACGPTPGQASSLTILQGYQPEFSTVIEEKARSSAVSVKRNLALSPGRYCTGFVTTVNNQNVSGRVELNVVKDKRYLLGMRYQAGSTTWSRTQGGVYGLRGHALTLLSASGAEITYIVKTISANSIEVWGDLPLSREACNQAPLEGAAYDAALQVAKDDLNSKYPW